MELPFEAVIGGFGSMAVALAALYRSQLKSQERCESNEVRLSAKVDKLEQYQRTEMAQHAERLATLLATAVPVLERALRVFRSYEHEQDYTPPPESSSRNKRTAGDTTALIKALR